MEDNQDAESGTLRGGKLLSRRWLLGASGGALLAAGCTEGSERGPADSRQKLVGKGAPGDPVAGPSGVLGANFNEDPANVDAAALNALSASWVRGFVLMEDIKEGQDPPRQVAIKKLLDLHGQGFGTILALKFQFSERQIPSPDGEAMRTELAAVDKVLDAVLDKVDIVTVGNEPFLETKRKDRATRLNPFYRKVADHVIAYRKKRFASGCRTHLYMGALNRLDDPEMTSKATEDWIEFVNKTPELEGLDIHPHVSSAEGVDEYLNYVLPKLRKDKRFLVTEFSLVGYYGLQMNKPIPDEIADAHDELDRGARLWQLLKLAADKRFTQKEWNTFLRKSPWFENHKHFMRNQVTKFRNTRRLAVATYGVMQQEAMVDKINKDKKPWMLNSLYVNRTVEHGANGELPHNYTVFDDFRALQREQDSRPVRPTKARM
jgi:hypothetical protein